MSGDIGPLLAAARQAVQAGDWVRAGRIGLQLTQAFPRNADGPFLAGLTQAAQGRAEQAAGFFERALSLDSSRFDAAIELAGQWARLGRQQEALGLLRDHEANLTGHAHYLNRAGECYFAMAHYESAGRLFEAAAELQPDAEGIAVNLASCAVYLGDIDAAAAIYRKLLKRHPRHQKLHYELAMLSRATDDRHVRQMQKLLQKAGGDPARNIWLHYALAKELEDLGRWDTAFGHLLKAGDAAKKQSSYQVQDDVDVIDSVIACCHAEWLADDPSSVTTTPAPIFVIGLPRTGTTLTERILSSHADVGSIGETQLLQQVLRDGKSAGNIIGITPEMIAAAAAREPADIAARYIDAVQHRVGEEAWFVEKLPENVLYLGFVAKAWPDAKIVHLRRQPMDACFAMFKQAYFRYAYTLADLAEYYLAYDRLSRHWQSLLAGRLVEVTYESLVADPDRQVRQLLQELDLPFDAACLNFSDNAAPVATASSVQVREKVHSRSVGRWKKFARHLQPLAARLQSAGISIEEGD